MEFGKFQSSRHRSASFFQFASSVDDTNSGSNVDHTATVISATIRGTVCSLPSHKPESQFCDTAACSQAGTQNFTAAVTLPIIRVIQ
jgi:hypothetical protein